MMPTGTAIAAAMPTITKVPAMALPKPPPVSKPVGGSSVNTSRLRRAPPRVISMYSTDSRGTLAINAPLQTSVVNTRLRRARPSNLRCRLGSAAVGVLRLVIICYPVARRP
jgi:hypothetical protein